MSKAAKQSIIILVVLLLAAFGFAALTLFEKLQLEQSAANLKQQIAEFQNREKKYIAESKSFNEKLKSAETASQQAESSLAAVNKELGEIKNKLDQLTQERDALQAELAELESGQAGMNVAKGEEPEKPAVAVNDRIAELEKSLAAKEAELQEALKASAEVPVIEEDDSYWAKILKEKKTLELKLENLENEMVTQTVSLEEVKKKNTELQLEIGRLKNEKEMLVRRIKQGNDLSDSLSLELARAENDKKFLSDQHKKLSEENIDLRQKIKQLTSTKVTLEKSIVNLQEERKNIERKLSQTETVIQQRVDEIWEIKDELEKNFRPMQKKASGEIELSPIVVSAQGPMANPSVDAEVGGPPGFDGQVISVNPDNNFVIVDLGSEDGLQLGDVLNVYRDSQYVAGLEVIQLRRDISAADIKTLTTPIQVGDIVR